jgi:hypothetical protein
MEYFNNFENYLITEAKIDDIYTKYYQDIDKELFDKIVKADPTSVIKPTGEIGRMGNYSKWLLKLYKNRQLLVEDLYKATSYLTTFNAIQSKIEVSERNIDKYDSLPTLFKFISTVGGTGKPSEDETYLIEDRYYINNGEAEIYYEDEKVLILIPKSYEASKFYAHATEWCTAYPDNYEYYTTKGNLYIIINKRNINSDNCYRLMQFHFEDAQFMDINDSEISRGIKLSMKKYFMDIKLSFLLNYDTCDSMEDGMATVILNDKCGVVDIEGNIIINPTESEYSHIDFFSEGRAMVQVKNNKTILVGYIDTTGKLLTPLIYNVLSSSFNDGMAFVCKRISGVQPYDVQLFGYINLDGEEVIPCQYYSAQVFHNEYAVVKNSSNMWGVIDKENNTIIPFEYNDSDSVQRALTMFRLNGSVPKNGKRL